jgi:hypothetical protein
MDTKGEGSGLRLRQETFAGAAVASVVRRHRRVDELS